MGSSGFCLPRSVSFPAGLRVLLVDSDDSCLELLDKMLKRCNYEVTTCKLALEALEKLQKNEFDIVISDVNMTDMDGFKFLEHVSQKLNLPVIIISQDGETSRVMKGVQRGACDYLLKPIRMKEIRYIWQHVLRKRIHDLRSIEGQSPDQTQQPDVDVISVNKRKEFDGKSVGEPSSVKKARVVWTSDLHQKFVKAIDRIGLDKAGPKKILDMMGVPWLTRENVASHLQKYRLYMSRMQKDNEQAGINLSDLSLKGPSGGNVCSVTMQQNMVINENCEQKFQIHNNSPSIYKGDVSGVNLPAQYTWGAGVSSPEFNGSYPIGTENSAASLSVQPHLTNITSGHVVDPVPYSMWSSKSHNLEENLPPKNVVVGTGPAQYGGNSSSIGDFYALNFDYDFLSNQVDPVMNQGYFT